MIKNHMSKKIYLDIRPENYNKGADIYPSYHRILAAKERCYCPNRCIKLTESSGEISLQGLLDLTVNRIFEMIGPEKTSIYVD